MHRNANRMGNLSGLALILLSVTVSSSHQDARIWDQDISFYAACAFPPMIGLVLAVSLASRFQLEKPERVAVSIESCYQNTGIATTVALTMFKSEKELATAIGVPLYYGVVEAILIFTFCIICWKCGWTKAPAHESICKVIATSYEVEHRHTTGQEESTAIEIVYGGGDDDASILRRNERMKYIDLIFSRQSENGDYIVDEQTLDQEMEIHKNITVPPPCPHSPTVTNSPTITEASDNDEMTTAMDDYNKRNSTTEIDQLRLQSRLGAGGRKTFSNIRAFATGYRRPLPFVYDTADNGDNYSREYQYNTNASIPEESRLEPSFSTSTSFRSSQAVGVDIDSHCTFELNAASSVSVPAETGTIPDTESLVLSSNSTKGQRTLRRKAPYETIATGDCSPRKTTAIPGF